MVQKHAGALFLVGAIYLSGRHVRRDPQAAAWCFRKAAEQVCRPLLVFYCHLSEPLMAFAIIILTNVFKNWMIIPLLRVMVRAFAAWCVYCWGRRVNEKLLDFPEPFSLLAGVHTCIYGVCITRQQRYHQSIHSYVYSC